jgi:signal transduction histidine kinase
MSVDEALQYFTSTATDLNSVHPDDRERIMVVKAEVFSEGIGFTTQYRLLFPSGRICYVLEICEGAFDDDGELIGTTGSLQDVTERVQSEKQQGEAQKMAAVVQLVGGIAHDFNNLITMINGYSELLLTDIRSDDPIHHSLLEIKRAGERAADLTRQLLAVGRVQLLQPELINLGETVLEMDRTLKLLVGQHIQLHITSDSGLKMIMADPAQMKRVVTDLVTNACDALPGGGKITLTLENASIDEKTIGDLATGRYVLLSVADTGIGMSEERISHVFEPFFTTQEQYKELAWGSLRCLGSSLRVAAGLMWKVSWAREQLSISIFPGRRHPMWLRAPWLRAQVRDSLEDPGGPERFSI